MGTLPVTILLAVVGQHYYATNLTVNTGPAAQEVWNALVDVKSAYVLVKDCHRRSTTECLRGIAPVNYLCDEKTLRGPYLEVGLADCTILQAEVNLTSPGTSVYLSEAVGLIISNITRFNYTNPGGTGSVTLNDVEGVVGLSAMSKMYIQDYVFFHQQSAAAALTSSSKRSSGMPMFEWTEDGPVYRQPDPQVQPPPAKDREGEFLPDADLTRALDSEHQLKSTYSIYDEGMPSVFSLDLQPPSSTQTSELVIGGYDDSAFTGPLQWSEPQLGAVEYPSLGFPIFDLRVCDVPLLGTLSSSWLAVPDTLTPCLGLPATAFDSLRAWALRTSPATVCEPDTSDRYICRVPSDVSPSSLPTLTFSLADVTTTTTVAAATTMSVTTRMITTTTTSSMTTSSSLSSSGSSSGWSEGGGGEDAWGDDPAFVAGERVSSLVSSSSSSAVGVLQIPLGSLLLDADESGARPLCVVRGDNITGGAYDFRDNPIVLGTLPLTQLYMVADTFNKRVGLANKPSTALPSSPQCAATGTCQGAQIYDRTNNECLPPRCSDYMFQEIDPDTNLCRFKTGFKVALALLSALAISAELLSHMWRAHIGPKSLHRTPLPPQPSTPRSGRSRGGGGGGGNGTNGHRGGGNGNGNGGGNDGGGSGSQRNGRWLPSLNREASSGVAGSGGGDAGSVGSGSSSPRAWMHRTASDVALLLTGGGAGGRGRRVVHR